MSYFDFFTQHIDIEELKNGMTEIESHSVGNVFLENIKKHSPGFFKKENYLIPVSYDYEENRSFFRKLLGVKKDKEIIPHVIKILTSVQTDLYGDDDETDTGVEIEIQKPRSKWAIKKE
jgi:acid phosphatase class B